MFNHSSTKKSLTLTTEANCFKMIADKNIKKGEEVFNSYGEVILVIF